jgi:hypothetical protein
MKDVASSKDLVAYCGLYCGACRAYLKGRCPGCHENVKAKWCKIRSCCGEHAYATCADCKEFTDPNACSRFHSLFSTVIGFVLNSNRQACVLKIRELGLDGFASFMAGRRRQTLPRRGA